MLCVKLYFNGVLVRVYTNKDCLQIMSCMCSIYAPLYAFLYLVGSMDRLFLRVPVRPPRGGLIAVY